MEGKRSVYYLEGLHCANCGEKIAREVGKYESVSASDLDIVNQRLFVTHTETIIPGLMEKIQGIVDRIEPGVVVKAGDDFTRKANRVSGSDHPDSHSHGHSHGHDEEGLTGIWTQKNIRIIIGATLFATGLILRDNKFADAMLFVSYGLIGWDVLYVAYRNILRGDIFDENFLMGIATIGAFTIGEYAEGVAVMLFYQVGEAFQDRAVNQSRKAIKSLLNIRPDTATLDNGFTTKVVPAEEVKVGDVIRVKPGERVPLDGRITSGESHLDTSALTGESVPQPIAFGDNVLSGVINLSGVISIEVTKDYSESTVSKILELVQNANTRKSKTEHFITRFARVYTPIVVLLSALIAIVPPLVTGQPFSEWVYRALVFLVVSCPCALVISIPLGFFGGVGGASRNGILIKGGNYLEALNQVGAVVFDKTGTLTQGRFTVREITVNNGFSQHDLVRIAAYAESQTTHPIGKSIVQAFGSTIPSTSVKKVNEIHGKGLTAVIDDGGLERVVEIGNDALIETRHSNGLPQVSDILDAITPGESASLSNPGETIIHVRIDGVYAGSFRIADSVKHDAADAIARLKRMGISRTVMLTGDRKSVAEKIATQLGVDEVHAELLPADKVSILENIEARMTGKRKKVIFVGDGVNDAPVLARADVGIAMGGLGSDAAIEAADVVIMTDEPSKIATAIEFARFTRKIVVQNIIFAMGIKILVLILGAGGLATMWEAVFADVGVALIAVLNASRVLKYKPGKVKVEAGV